ncbi:MAG: WYL domain-containing protein [Spirochaetales bacterium]|nr:WYL domain-containing protein [Spirochaetales bacterium]
MSFSIDNYLIVSRLMSRSNGTTIKEMANALKVSDRQVYNILEQMYFVLNFEQYNDPENQRLTRYKSIGDSPKLNLPDLKLTDDEIAVFNLIKENAELSPALRQTAETLFEKIQLMASERGKKINVGESSRRLILNARTIHKSIGEEKASRAINALLDIINKQHWMDLEYRTRKAAAPHPYTKLYPLQLFSSDGDVYIYVLNRYKQLRMLAVERIEKITSYEGEKVECLYDFRKLLSDPFGIMLEEPEPYKVKLWINPHETSYLKDKDWPDSIEITENDDGSSIFEAETRTHYECVKWIQSRIDRVKILEPAWLRDEILKNLNQGLSLNSSN